MKKLMSIKYEGVILHVSESLQLLDKFAKCPLNVGYSPVNDGICSNFKFIEPGKLSCDVDTTKDLKGRYPILHAEILENGFGRLLSLSAVQDKLNADETLEPFI